MHRRFRREKAAGLAYRDSISQIWTSTGRWIHWQYPRLHCASPTSHLLRRQPLRAFPAPGEGLDGAVKIPQSSAFFRQEDRWSPIISAACSASRAYSSLPTKNDAPTNANASVPETRGSCRRRDSSFLIALRAELDSSIACRRAASSILLPVSSSSRSFRHSVRSSP